MATQHSAIVDADRHEAKGASTATNGQVLKANGDGTTTFATPSILTNVVVTNIFEGIDATTQSPSAVDTPLTVLFGNAAATSDVSLSSAGVVTFNNTGYYEVEIVLNAQRTTGAGQAKLLARVLLNGTAIEPVYGVILPDNLVAASPIRIKVEQSFTATSTLSVQIMRDSSGINNGSLVPIDPVLAGWSNVPSAYIKIKKKAGMS